jgi:predicted ATP-grasp superfamily ATP-dependent carboligase
MKKSVHPSVLVTDASRGSAISIIRSLGRKGIRVIATDSTCQCLGFHSRYTDETFVYPSPEIAPFDFVDSLAYAVRHKEIDLIIPVTDATILPLSEARKKFEGICQLCIPEPVALELVTNKKKTLDLASRLGVPIPETCVVYTLDEALKESNRMGWPVVLKPIVSRKLREKKSIESFTVSYAGSPEQLSTQMRNFEGRCPVLLQEYYPGVGCGVELLLYQGLPRAAFQHQRIREIPINGGASSFRESVMIDPELYDYATRMMQALCWTGLAMVEFKIGKDGPKLMEINGRVWGSLPLAVLSGMDFPAHLADLYFSSPPENPSVLLKDYKVGIRARNLELDILWILTVLKGKKRYPFLPIPGRGEAVKALLGLMNPGYRFDILSLDDPLPGLFEIRKVIRKVSKKIQENAWRE